MASLFMESTNIKANAATAVRKLRGDIETHTREIAARKLALGEKVYADWTESTLDSDRINNLCGAIYEKQMLIQQLEAGITETERARDAQLEALRIQSAGPAPAASFCGKCGAPNAPGARFCCGCGQPMA